MRNVPFKKKIRCPRNNFSFEGRDSDKAGGDKPKKKPKSSGKTSNEDPSYTLIRIRDRACRVLGTLRWGIQLLHEVVKGGFRPETNAPQGVQSGLWQRWTGGGRKRWGLNVVRMGAVN